LSALQDGAFVVVTIDDVLDTVLEEVEEVTKEDEVLVEEVEVVRVTGHKVFPATRLELAAEFAATLQALLVGFANGPPILHCCGATRASNLPKSGVPRPLTGSHPQTAENDAPGISLVQPVELPVMMSFRPVYPTE
jgi:hypothetical protein